MTSLTVFRPLSLTHLHGDRFFFPSNSAFWLPHGGFNHIVYGKPSVVWLCDSSMLGPGVAESTAALRALLQWWVQVYCLPTSSSLSCRFFWNEANLPLSERAFPSKDKRKQNAWQAKTVWLWQTHHNRYAEGKQMHAGTLLGTINVSFSRWTLLNLNLKLFY